MIAITAVAHAYRYGDPEWHLPVSYNFTLVCVIIYYMLQGAYYYVEWFEVGDLFYASNGAPDTSFEKVEFRSKVNRETANYELKVTPFGKKGKEAVVSVNWKISDLIDEKGYVHRYLVRDSLEKFLTEFKGTDGKKQK